jgi:flagellar basal-body rod modification protein FlgD
VPAKVTMKLPPADVQRADLSHINTKLDPEQMARSKQASDEVNQKNKILGKKYGESLDKDSFLKLLVTELTHQDPTAPMQDKEFIAQMAQFSSLEQMNNMNKNMQNMSAQGQATEAYGMLGKRIQSFNPEKGRMIDGTVTSVAKRGGEVFLMVGDKPVKMDEVSMVLPPDAGVAANSNVIQNGNADQYTAPVSDAGNPQALRPGTPAIAPKTVERTQPLKITAPESAAVPAEQNANKSVSGGKRVINQLNNFSNYYDTIKDKAAAAYSEQSVIAK